MSSKTEPDAAHQTPGKWRRLAWFPIALLVSAMAVLWVADLRIAWPSSVLNGLFAYGSVAIGVAFIVIPAALSFLANGQLSVLMLGCGMLMMDVGAAATMLGAARSSNVGFAIYNTSILLGALCQFSGVVATSRYKIRLKRPVQWLVVAYASGIAAMGLVIGSAFLGWMPVFFIDGQGGTLLRGLVVGTAVALFLLTAGLLWQTNRSAAAPFFFWYALGLVLLAAGLAGSMMISLWDSPLQWVTRFTQVVGTIYMCAAVLLSLRDTSTKEIPLAAVENTWREHDFLANFRQQSLRGWMRRTILALAIVTLAIALRLALTAWVGPGLPTYITFYPAVMVAALLGGLGPGITATALAGTVVAYWILPPIGQVAIASPVDRLGLVIFTAMGLLMSVVAELYRRNRDKAAAYERESALSESREVLRRQAELIDPVRAEVIAREMQRVVRERGDAKTASSEPKDDMFRHVPAVAGAVVAAIGAIVLTGWTLGLPLLKSVLPGFASMKSNTALCFVLGGVALPLRERRAVRLICAGLVALVAGLTLAEYMTGGNFGLDELLFVDTVDVHTIFPGRMVEATALGFLFISASLLLLKAQGRAALWVQQALAVGAAAIGTVAILGYAYDVQPFYRFTGYASMALHTAASLTLLAAGLTFARRDGMSATLITPGPGAQLTRRLLPGAILLPAIIGWLRVHGTEARLFEPNFGTGLFALSMIFAFTALIWWTARAVNRVDAERRETETQLRNQAELMNQAYGPLIVREPGGVIRSWNRGAEALYGWSAADAVGRPKQLLLRTEGCSLEKLDRRLEQDGRWEGELSHTSRDGRRIVVENRQTATHAADGRLLILESETDITERKQAEESLRLSEKKYAAAFANNPAAIALTRLDDGLFLEVNDTWVTLNGYSREEAVGHSAREMGIWPTAEDANRFVQELREKGFVHGWEQEFRRKSGEVYIAQLFCQLLTVRGEKVILSTLMDISERKRIEQLLVKQMAQLEAANKELECFSYSVSHDLRAPLRAIDGYSRMILQRQGDRLDKETSRQFQMIRDSVKNMGKLIDDLLAFSRLGRQEVARVDLDMEALIRDAWQELATIHPDRKMSLAIGLMPAALGDQTLIRQVFGNLMGNAVKFTKTREAAVIEVGSIIKDNETVYYIEDNGIGFDMQFYGKLFGVFQRLHSDTEYEGTGIGLALVHRIIQRHGGRIWAEGKVDEGATFYFTLPTQQG